ncbi:DUF389 domain-containing protein [Pontibacter akesuensis]|uniref:Uncharacterized hydrophobic domain-containing protein n=1 Tax=Pontibacter akesuensis TaxID=388950 RepID=A0A1I7JWC2_9BACT|nr:DUF389 domain-containing protein [Pontibacter akesuensis]GHA77137.1 hypothetical protein GCM10007389_33950 [Pontibacter akesuensis]SFU89511.1 uncharacterized hydrophobic domain-containing protein [Pontibacter akesuensis]
MRQLSIKVKQGEGREIQKIAKEHNGKNLQLQPLEDGELLTLHLNNQKVSSFLESISKYEDAEITLIPRGIITLYPPQGEAPDQVADVSLRSPIEIFLGGIQSVGSKKGMLIYSAAGGILVWVGLYTGTVYLLVAAMLVSPFAGPAMNAALAAAAGKMQLLKQSLMRYFMAIGTGILVTFLLSFFIDQKFATPLMVSVSHISQMSILLPIVAGLAGGVNLISSERDSLVPGAAVGVLVAASLAPPTGLIGMAVNFGNWQLVRSGVFLLLLQLAVIQLTAALIFRYMGKVTTNGVRFADGKAYVFKLSLAVSTLLVAGLLYWQYAGQPGLQKGSVNVQIASVIRTELNKMEGIEPIEVNARFTRGTLPNLNPVICEVYLYKRNDAMTDEEVKKLVSEVLYARVKAEDWNADPMFSITVLNYPGKAEKP